MPEGSGEGERVAEAALRVAVTAAVAAALPLAVAVAEKGSALPVPEALAPGESVALAAALAVVEAEAPAEGVVVAVAVAVAVPLGEGLCCPQQTTLPPPSSAQLHVSPQATETKPPPAGAPDTCPFELEPKQRSVPPPAAAMTQLWYQPAETVSALPGALKLALGPLAWPKVSSPQQPTAPDGVSEQAKSPPQLRRILQKKMLLDRKMKRAEEKRMKHLEAIIRKAHDEEEKKKEIAFITSLEAQNKRHDFIAHIQTQEERIQGLQVLIFLYIIFLLCNENIKHSLKQCVGGASKTTRRAKSS